MRAFHSTSLFLLACLPLLGLAACDGDGSNTGGSGGTTATSTGGSGGSGATGGTSTGGTGGTSTGGTGGASTGGTGGAGGTGGTGGTGGGNAKVDCSPADGAVPALKLTTVAQGLSRPVLVRAAPGDDERLFIVEQTGKIRIFKDGALQDKPFLDISDRTRQPQGGDERGLLGLAFHPDYANNGRFFVFYTDKSNQGGSTGNQNIAEYARMDADTAMADANGFGAEVQKLFNITDTESNHNGGMLEFSPSDGMLYIGLGDGGGAGDNHGSFGNGQNLATFWGKILRVDVSTTPYSIPPGNMTAVPAGNPTAGDVKPEIWDFGLRNPWRFAFDPCTDELYIGDVGQGSVEEVDIEAKGDGQKNYGWKYYEGSQVYSSNTQGFDQAVVTAPVDEYSHSGGNCSISGGFVYRSSAVPGLRGRYFYADYCSGRVWSFRWDGAMIQDKMEHTADLSPPGSLVSFGYDNLGNVYLTSLNGDVYRIDAE